MRFIAAVSLIVWISTVPAWAALGERRDSIKSDTDMLKGQLSTQAFPRYSVDQIKRGDGAILREFVSPQGQVFGFAWQGPTMPNLAQLLGNYAEAFKKAAESSHHRGPLSLRIGPLVVQTGGHMRDFRVRAYLANQLPDGVSEEVVR